MLRSKYLIYALVDPRTGAPRYVGRSSNGFYRPRTHGKSYSLNTKTHKAQWIRQLLALGLSYEIKILEVLPDKEGLSTAEIRWIAQLRSEGANLTNHTIGGEGSVGYKHSPEVLEKIKKLNQSPTRRRHLSLVNLGKKASAEAKEAMRAAHLGKKLSPTHVANAARSRRGKKRPPETCAKLAAARARRVYGPLSDEIKKRIGDTMRGKPKSPETVARMKAAWLKRKAKQSDV